MRKVTLAFTQLMLFKQAIEEFNNLAKEAKLTLNARVAYVIHKNQSNIYAVYWAFMADRNKLIHRFAELDESNEVKFVLKDKDKEPTPENMEVVWADKEGYEKSLNELMEQDFEVNFYFDNQIQRYLGSIVGEQSVISNLFQLLDIFENYGKK